MGWLLAYHAFWARDMFLQSLSDLLPDDPGLVELMDGRVCRDGLGLAKPLAACLALSAR